MREPTASSCPREIVDRRAFSFRLQKRDKPRSIFTIAERSSMATPLDVVFAQIQPARAIVSARRIALFCPHPNQIFSR
jgi:hypothetical protein